MSGLPAMRAFSVTAWQTVLFETKFGHVWQLRLGLIVLALALVALGLAQVQARHAVIDGRVFDQHCFTRLASLDQPRCGCQSATARSFR